MLEAKNISKSFGKNLVLKNISLTVEEGERLVIIGPSGCGKSTLLRCLNYIEKPNKGKVLFEGRDLSDSRVDINKIRMKMGMVFQQFNLFPHLTVLENMILAPTKLKIMRDEEAKKKAISLLESIDLKDKKDFYPSQLSGGQKQRVAIVRAMLMDPKMMLFDEPTSALDPEMIGEVTSLMQKLGDDGMTMVVVSHEMNFVKNFATRVIFMENGTIIEEGGADQIFNHPKNERLKEFLSKVD